MLYDTICTAGIINSFLLIIMVSYTVHSTIKNQIPSFQIQFNIHSVSHPYKAIIIAVDQHMTGTLQVYFFVTYKRVCSLH